MIVGLLCERAQYPQVGHLSHLCGCSGCCNMYPTWHSVQIKGAPVCCIYFTTKTILIRHKGYYMSEQMVIVICLVLVNILILLGISMGKAKNKLRHFKSVHANAKSLADIRRKYNKRKGNS